MGLAQEASAGKPVESAEGRSCDPSGDNSPLCTTLSSAVSLSPHGAHYQALLSELLLSNRATGFAQRSPFPKLQEELHDPPRGPGPQSSTARFRQSRDQTTNEPRGSPAMTVGASSVVPVSASVLTRGAAGICSTVAC
jgi:hypothetical protein